HGGRLRRRRGLVPHQLVQRWPVRPGHDDPGDEPAHHPGRHAAHRGCHRLAAGGARTAGHGAPAARITRSSQTAAGPGHAPGPAAAAALCRFPPAHWPTSAAHVYSLLYEVTANCELVQEVTVW